MTDSRAGPAHGRRRRRRGRQDRARRGEALHVHRGQPRREAQQGQAARVAQAPRRRRRAGADRRGLCGNQPVSRVHPIILHQVISRWWRGSVERRGTGIATPSSRRRVDGVEDDAAIQHERAVNFDFRTAGRRPAPKAGEQRPRQLQRLRLSFTSERVRQHGRRGPILGRAFSDGVACAQINQCTQVLMCNQSL